METDIRHCVIVSYDFTLITEMKTITGAVTEKIAVLWRRRHNTGQSANLELARVSIVVNGQLIVDVLIVQSSVVVTMTRLMMHWKQCVKWK